MGAVGEISIGPGIKEDSEKIKLPSIGIHLV